MNSLISNCLKRGDINELLNFPEVLMRTDEREMIAWVRTYRARYRASPSLERFMLEFPTFAVLEERAPLAEILEECLTRKRNIAVQAAATALLEGEEDPEKVAKELLLRLRAQSSELVSFSTFDRAAYFVDREPLWLLTDGITRLTGGIMNAELCYIVGRLGIGKTMLTQWTVYNWWLNGKRILMTSNEMSATELMSRFDGFVGGINPLSLRRREIGPSDHRLLAVSHIASASKGDILIAKNRPRTPSEIASIVESSKADVVVIDGVYLLVPDGGKRSAMWESVAEISRSLKQISLDHDVPVIGVHQASRQAREKVTAYDIAYSDAVGQDADIVIGASHGRDEGEILVELVKNRGGPSIGVSVRVDFDTMLITEVPETAELPE